MREKATLLVCHIRSSGSPARPVARRLEGCIQGSGHRARPGLSLPVHRVSLVLPGGGIDCRLNPSHSPLCVDPRSSESHRTALVKDKILKGEIISMKGKTKPIKGGIKPLNQKEGNS